jgi:hypothetical protein
LDTFQFQEILTKTQTLAVSKMDVALNKTPNGYQNINYVVYQALKSQNLIDHIILTIQSTVVQVATAQNFMLMSQPSFMK